MERKNTSKTIIVAVAIALFVAVVGGATFAYWQWITSDDQQTAVNVTVAQGINHIITPEPGDTAVNVKMRPTNTETDIIEDCAGEGDSKVCTLKNDAVMVDYTQVKIENQTGIVARPKYMLKLKITKGGTNITDTETVYANDDDAKYRDYINYAVVEGGAIKDFTGPINGTSGSWAEEGDCDTPIVSGTFAAWDNETTTEVDETTTGFNQIGTTGWFNSPYITLVDDTQPINFPILTSGLNNTISFNAMGYTTTYHRYKVCVWIDESYVSVNTGDTVSDPLQDATIEVSWSEESEVIQVTE